MSENKLEQFPIKKFVKTKNDLRAIILGFTGSGKTEFGKILLREYQKSKKRNIIVMDTKYEFDHIKKFESKNVMSQGLLRRIRGIKVRGNIYENPIDVCEYASALAWYWKPSILYVEEIPNIVSRAENLPSSHKNLYKVIQQGRSKSIGFVCASQKINQLNKQLLDESTDIFIFALIPSACRKLEESLELPKGSLKFNLPDELELGKPLEKLSSKERKDLYSFYRITKSGSIKQYAPLPIKKFMKAQDLYENQIESEEKKKELELKQGKKVIIDV